MSKVEKSKGYLSLTGRIIALNNKKVIEKDKSKELKFGLQVAKDHVIYVRAFGWKKEENDTILVEYYENKKRKTKKDIYSNAEWLAEGETVVGTKIKLTTDGEVQSFVDFDAVDKIKEGFKDGDCVTVNISTEVDTYYKTLKYNINKIYASSKELNFEKSDFEEECHGRQWVSFNKVENDILNAFVFDKDLEAVGLKFKLNTDYVKAEDFKEFKHGSVLQIEFETYKKPIYEEVTEKTKEDSKEKTNKFIPKGKYASESKNNDNNVYQQITGYEEVFIVTGITNLSDNIYDLTPYLETEDSNEIPF